MSEPKLGGSCWWVYALTMRGPGEYRYVRVGFTQDVPALTANLLRILPGELTRAHRLRLPTREACRMLAAELIAAAPSDVRLPNGWLGLDRESHGALPEWWRAPLERYARDPWPWQRVDLSGVRQAVESVLACPAKARALTPDPA